MKLENIKKHLSKKMIENIYNNNLYIISYNKIFQAFYSQAQQQYYFNNINKTTKILTRKNDFKIVNGEEVNHAIGFQYVI